MREEGTEAANRRPMAHHGEERNNGVNIDRRDEAPSDDALRMANAFSQKMAELVKLRLDLKEMHARSANTQNLIEDLLRKGDAAKAACEAKMAELNDGKAENERLEKENKEFDMELRSQPDPVQVAALMQDRYKKCLKEIERHGMELAPLSAQCDDIMDRIKAIKNKQATLLKNQELLKKGIDRCTRKCERIKPFLMEAAKFLAECLRNGAAFPAHIVAQLNAFRIDDTLEIAKPAADGDDEMDDGERDEAMDRIMKAPAPRFGPRGKGSRGGRGGYKRKGMEGGRNVVDESMHDDLLARKLRRDESDETPAASADQLQPVAAPVMGRKTETVREQQERQKAGRKQKIADMKKEEKAKQAAPKASSWFCDDREMSLMEQLQLSDDDEDEEEEEEEKSGHAGVKMKEVAEMKQEEPDEEENNGHELDMAGMDKMMAEVKEEMKEEEDDASMATTRNEYDRETTVTDAEEKKVEVKEEMAEEEIAKTDVRRRSARLRSSAVLMESPVAAPSKNTRKSSATPKKSSATPEKSSSTPRKSAATPRKSAATLRKKAQ